MVLDSSAVRAVTYASSSSTFGLKRRSRLSCLLCTLCVLLERLLALQEGTAGACLKLLQVHKCVRGPAISGGLVYVKENHSAGKHRDGALSSPDTLHLTARRMPPPCLQSRPDTFPCPPAPQMCRLAEMTYCADITVDIEYTRGREIVVKRGENGVGAVQIGRLPLMLRSDRCRLKGCSEAQLAALGARPATPAPALRHGHVATVQALPASRLLRA